MWQLVLVLRAGEVEMEDVDHDFDSEGRCDVGEARTGDRALLVQGLEQCT